VLLWLLHLVRLWPFLGHLSLLSGMVSAAAEAAEEDARHGSQRNGNLRPWRRLRLSGVLLWLLHLVRLWPFLGHLSLLSGMFLSVSACGSPTNWSHDDGAVFFRHPDDNLHPANHWSTAPSCPGIKFIENIVHTTSSAGTSTAAAIKELPLRQRASGHGGSAAMKLLMFFVLPQLLIDALPPQAATEVRDILLSPLGDTPYDTLKEALVSRLVASEQRRLQQLLSAEELGDRRPSQFLRHLQHLLGDKAASIDAAILRELFLQRLPPPVRVGLAVAHRLPLLELAKLADRIMEVNSPTIGATQRTSDLTSDIAELRKAMEKLTAEVSELRRESS
ncbi:hypothetical protein HPB47_017145, partial [Ixodes persulcatus]